MVFKRREINLVRHFLLSFYDISTCFKCSQVDNYLGLWITCIWCTEKAFFLAFWSWFQTDLPIPVAYKIFGAIIHIQVNLWEMGIQTHLHYISLERGFHQEHIYVAQYLLKLFTITVGLYTLTTWGEQHRPYHNPPELYSVDRLLVS